MKRYLYRAQMKAGEAGRLLKIIAEQGAAYEKGLREKGVLTFSCFRCGDQLFIYLEADVHSEPFHLELPVAIQELLAAWPGEEHARYVVPMNDVFHDGVPLNGEQWRGGRTVEARVGSLARLKPEMYASYVFYHYQMQEEHPETFNQTYIIGSHERLIFSYFELPATLSGQPRKGLLDTKLTPSNWHEVMEPHFEPWMDTGADETLWRKLEPVFSF